MTLNQFSHLLNDLSILTIPYMLTDTQPLIATIMNTIYCRTAVAHIVMKYILAADVERDGEIDLSYIPTVEMLADCFPKPLPKPAILKPCPAMEMIWMQLENVHVNGLGILWNRDGNVTRTWNRIENAPRNYIDWVRLFWGDPRYLIGSCSLLFTVLFEVDVPAVQEKCWADWKDGYHYAKDHDVTCLICR